MSSRVLLLRRRRAHTGYRHFPCQSNPYPQPLPSPAPTSGAFARDLNSGALHPSKRRALREWIPPSILSPGFCVREQNSASRANPAPFSGGGIMANGNSQFGGNNSSFFDAAARGGNNSQFRGKQFTVPGAAAQGLELHGYVLESSPLRSFPGGRQFAVRGKQFLSANGNSQFGGNNSQFPAPPRRVWNSADMFSNPAPFVPFPAGACRSCPRTSAQTRRRRGVERPRKQVQVGIRVS